MAEENTERPEEIYVRRGGVYLLDEHAGVMIDSAGNFLAKTRGDSRALAAMLRLIADDIDAGPSRLAREWAGEWPESGASPSSPTEPEQEREDGDG